MKLGLYIDLGPLLATHRQRNLELASQLRDRGVRHVAFAGLPESADPVEATAQLDALGADAIGVTTSVRSTPRIVAQNKADGVTELEGEAEWLIEAVAQDTATDEWKNKSAKWLAKYGAATPERLTSNFTINRESIERVNKLVLRKHGTYVAHEVHKTLDGPLRAWICGQVKNPVIYYGTRGLWKKYCKDFPDYDVPHTMHVALNGAGPTDDSAEGVPGPDTSRVADITNACKALNERLAGKCQGWPDMQAHINVLETTPASRMVAMAYTAFDLLPSLGVLMFRVVDTHGETLSGPDGRHVIAANVLEAIGEMT